MGTLDDMLAAVVANPEDDARKLVYADALIERGDALGEFIAVQCELSRTELSAERRAMLVTRERELLAEHAPLWLAGVRSPVFEKGFLVEATIEAAVFLERRPQAQHPLLRRATLSSAGAVARALARSPVLSPLRSLTLDPVGEEGDSLARELAASEHLQDLESLRFAGGVTNSGASAIAASLHLSRLGRLAFLGSRVDGDGAVVLVESQSLKSLVNLRLEGERSEGEDATERDPPRSLLRRLVESPGCSRLRHLSWSRQNVERGDVIALVRSAQVRGLESLILESCFDLASDPSLLVDSSNLEHLRTLGLSRNWLRRRGQSVVAELAEECRLPSLEVLGLRRVGVDGVDALALAASPGLERLRLLDLRENDGLGDRARAALRARFGQRVLLTTSRGQV